MSEMRIPPAVADLIGGFRAERDDLQDPLFAALADWLAADPRHQEWFEKWCDEEEVLTRAFQDVPVPARLRQRLREAHTGQRGASVHRPSIGVAPVRHRWRWLATGMASAAVVLLLAVLWQPRLGQPPPASPPAIAADRIGQAAVAWSEQLSSRGWKQDMSSAPTARPLYQSTLPSAKAWTTLPTELDEQVVAYDLSPARESRVHVFVLGTLLRLANVGAEYPLTPVYSSASYSAGVCRRGNLTYVLVVQGDANAYRNMLLRSRLD